MCLAERVRSIRESHGDSLREAERRTGISRATLHRWELGQHPRNLDELVRRFAAGYGTPADDLLEASAPKAVFEWRIRRMERGERMRLLRAAPQERVRVALEFALGPSPAPAELRRLASAASLPLHELEQAITTWRRFPPDLRTAQMVAEGLHMLMGFSLSWLLYGHFAHERGQTPGVSRSLPRYGLAAQKARPVTRASLVQELGGVLRRRSDPA